MGLKLVSNPQTLVSSIFINKECQIEIDAIYIPCISKVNLPSDIFQWFRGKIYLIPSLKYHNLPFPTKKQLNSILFVPQKFISYFFSNFLTYGRPYSDYIISSIGIWDLPIKRNFALYHAIKNGYKKILLIDDDINGLLKDYFENASFILRRYNLCGCFVQDYPDTSIVGHIERQVNGEIKCFLSGSYLFINLYKCFSFFPFIYNEDWVFMVPFILHNEVCSFGEVKQLKYNPFNDHKKVIFQEFGEVIAEGLFALISNNLFERRKCYTIWKEILELRKNYIKKLINKTENNLYLKFLNWALQANSYITPEICLSYIEDIDRDIIRWNSLIRSKIL